MAFSGSHEANTDLAARRPSGGQSKFSPSRAASIVTAIEAGAFAGSAAASVGVSRWTLNRWRQRGERELARASEFVDYPDVLVADLVDEVEANGGGVVESLSAQCVPPFAEAEWPFVLLMHHLKRAKARAEIRAVQSILSQGHEGRWQALAWWLERAHPAEYGRRRASAQNLGFESLQPSTALAGPAPTAEQLLERILEMRSRGQTPLN